MLPQKQIDVLQQFLEQQSAIIAGYVFGSFAKGTQSGASDIDIAVQLSSRVAPDAYADLAGRYTVELSERLGRETDVIVLNEAPPFLKFQVFRYGQRLFERDQKQSRSFLAASLLEYFDFEPLKRAMEQRIVQRLKEQPL